MTKEDDESISEMEEAIRQADRETEQAMEEELTEYRKARGRVREPSPIADEELEIRMSPLGIPHLYVPLQVSHIMPAQRKLVPLQLGEVWLPFSGSVPMPEGMRLETDEEFRNRIVSETKDRKETK